MIATAERPRVTLAPAGLEIDEATHTYKLNGQVVPGVTSIIGPATGYEHVPDRFLRAAQELGTHTHMATELDDRGNLDESSVSVLVAPRLAAWRKFCRDHGCRWLHIEAMLYSEQFLYAGTVDRIGYVDGVLTVVEIKTSAKRVRAWGLQLSAYRIAAGLPGVRRVSVRLLADGTYAFDEFRDESEDAVFRGLIPFYFWKNK